MFELLLCLVASPRFSKLLKPHLQQLVYTTITYMQARRRAVLLCVWRATKLDAVVHKCLHGNSLRCDKQCCPCACSLTFDPYMNE
jgi:hypothetical protein